MQSLMIVLYTIVAHYMLPRCTNALRAIKAAILIVDTLHIKIKCVYECYHC